MTDLHLGFGVAKRLHDLLVGTGTAAHFPIAHWVVDFQLIFSTLRAPTRQQRGWQMCIWASPSTITCSGSVVSFHSHHLVDDVQQQPVSAENSRTCQQAIATLMETLSRQVYDGVPALTHTVRFDHPLYLRYSIDSSIFLLLLRGRWVKTWTWTWTFLNELNETDLPVLNFITGILNCGSRCLSVYTCKISSGQSFSRHGKRSQRPGAGSQKACK